MIPPGAGTPPPAIISSGRRFYWCPNSIERVSSFAKVPHSGTNYGLANPQIRAQGASVGGPAGSRRRVYWDNGSDLPALLLGSAAPLSLAAIWEAQILRALRPEGLTVHFRSKGFMAKRRCVIERLSAARRRRACPRVPQTARRQFEFAVHAGEPLAAPASVACIDEL